MGSHSWLIQARSELPTQIGGSFPGSIYIYLGYIIIYHFYSTISVHGSAPRTQPRTVPWSQALTIWEAKALNLEPPACSSLVLWPFPWNLWNFHVKIHIWNLITPDWWHLVNDLADVKYKISFRWSGIKLYQLINIIAHHLTTTVKFYLSFGY